MGFYIGNALKHANTFREDMQMLLEKLKHQKENQPKGRINFYFALPRGKSAQDPHTLDC